MVSALEISVQNLLRSSEELKTVLEVQTIPEELEEDYYGESQSPGSYEVESYAVKRMVAERRRVLAVVMHVDTSSGEEQGCLFVLRPKLTGSLTLTERATYTVEHAYPIFDGFSISMAQPRRKTLDLSSTQVLTEPRSELALTIHPGHGSTADSLPLVTSDVQGLKHILSESKRLRDIAAANSELGSVSPYPWIVPYTLKRKPSILSSIPQDLRHAHRPVVDLLSQAFAGSPGDDQFDISIIREHWIRSQVNDLYNSSAHQVRLKLRIGTFNVNGKLPSQDLSAWVRGGPKLDPKNYIPPLDEISPFNVDEVTKNPMENVDVATLSIKDDVSTIFNSNTIATTLGDEDDPDLIVLGFQELDLSAGALLYSTEKTREEAWHTAVLAGLGEKASVYEKLASKQLVGMLLLILVKSGLRERFTNVQATYVGAGIMGLMGNKGATAIRLTFSPHPKPHCPSPRPVVLTFVNSHLAAFDEMYEKRNTDFHDISKRLSFDSGVPLLDAAAQQVGQSPLTAPLNVYQSDALFWLGDLNYRLNIPDSDVRALLAEDTADSLQMLQNYDQLKLAMRTEKAFLHFGEHKISHLPSYRFSGGALSDNLGYDLKRKPAWTDRVLHMPSAAARVKQTSYASHKEVTMSDHRPISAVFELAVPVVDADELETFVHDIWKEVSNFEESEDFPRIAVEPTLIDFGKIGYQRAVKKSVQLRNTGKIPLVFRFIPTMPSDSIHPDWIHVHPLTGLVRPGACQEIELLVTVDDRAATQLNVGDARLEATLILHTALGKDGFITVCGEYERTCFATSLPRLTRLPGPVRSSDAQTLLPEDQAATAPKEVMRLVSWLMGNATEVPELFLVPGDPILIREIRESLDTGSELPALSEKNRHVLSLSVASCLMELLKSLPEPLAPCALHPACTDVMDRDEAFELLNDFPSASVNVWISMTSLLHFISQQEAEDSVRPKAEHLAAVFAPILLRDDPDMSRMTSPVGKRRFLLFFISS